MKYKETVKIKLKYKTIIIALLLLVGYVYFLRFTFNEIRVDREISLNGVITKGVIYDKRDKIRGSDSIKYKYDVDGKTYYSGWKGTKKGLDEKIGSEIEVIYLKDEPLESYPIINGKKYDLTFDIIVFTLLFFPLLTSVPIFLFKKLYDNIKIFKNVKISRFFTSKKYSEVGFYFKVEKLKLNNSNEGKYEKH